MQSFLFLRDSLYGFLIILGNRSSLFRLNSLDIRSKFCGLEWSFLIILQDTIIQFMSFYYFIVVHMGKKRVGGILFSVPVTYADIF